MDIPGKSRRSFLSSVSLLGMTALSGCAGLSLGSSSQKPVQIETSQASFNEQPLKAAPASTDGATIHAALFTTKSDIDQQLDLSALPVTIRHTCRTIDFSTHFIAALVADTQLVAPTTSMSWCPTSQVDDDEFLFKLPLKQWPAQKAFGTPTVLVGRFEKWELRDSSAPSQAIVELEFVPPDEERVCGD
ncbi:hypothetical protein [Haladaptatus salinisoli]|uniref:hypothetical protein n=1 Tax=Haladaptatus salinisoli TaxID=2884876 RepID=UPI001D0B120C|nr:hypothetical protein [Haladaptatus salinisoli]